MSWANTTFESMMAKNNQPANKIDHFSYQEPERDELPPEQWSVPERDELSPEQWP